jgi:transcriptional regulator with GAF, ATPase, and Fis domain
MTDTPTAESVFADLHAAAREISTARLFTVTVLDPKAGVSRRAYTSHPQDYPVSGTKPMVGNGWSEKVILRRETFVANTTAEFSPYFPDYPLINALGCHSAINIPVARDGQVMGTVNILDEENHFTPERVAALAALVDSRREVLLEAFAQD